MGMGMELHDLRSELSSDCGLRKHWECWKHEKPVDGFKKQGFLTPLIPPSLAYQPAPAALRVHRDQEGPRILLAGLSPG